ncbi:MAG: hypothetical protein ACRC1R_08580 [Cetobacterium sp.]|uniref:hypothetical protein n=1 Tax=Cetobacterium sp. TaxID=2071632 RepID=UPI003F2CBE07
MKSYKEILIKFLVLKNSSKEEVLREAINVVDKYICLYSKEYHEKSTLKDYSVSRIEPCLCETFRRGDIISIKVRTDIEEIAKAFENNLLENTGLKTIFTDIKTIHVSNKISEIYSLTPIILSGESENKYILANRNNLEELKAIILKHAKAKCQLPEEYDFIETITVKNKYPISINIPREVGGITYLGDKLQIKIKSDKLSQNIANTFIVKGMGKHCTCGNGFINYKI